MEKYRLEERTKFDQNMWPFRKAGDWFVLKNGDIVRFNHAPEEEKINPDDIEWNANEVDILRGGYFDEYELRMYFFVPYNILPIQHGIQAGNALGEYALKYGRYDTNHIVWDFLGKYKTFMIYNGGTTNNFRLFEVPKGSLNKLADSVHKMKIEYSTFYEEDLNDALTACCMIIDERVWNKRVFPDFVDWLLKVSDYKLPEGSEIEDVWLGITPLSREELQLKFSEYYKEWVKFLGGEKNVFLRDLLKGKRFV